MFGGIFKRGASSSLAQYEISFKVLRTNSILLKLQVSKSYGLNLYNFFELCFFSYSVISFKVLWTKSIPSKQSKIRLKSFKVLRTKSKNNISRIILIYYLRILLFIHLLFLILLQKQRQGKKRQPS